VRAVHGATETLVGPGIQIDAEVLVTLARACRDTVRVRFRYAARDGGEHERTVEPVRMVATARRWYLMAWDGDRGGWRTFRLDRMRDVTATTWHFRPREHPDPVAYVQRSVTAAPYRHLARVRLHAPSERVRELVPPQVGRVEDDRDGWCVLIVGGDDLDWLAVHIARLGFEAEVLEPPELRDAAARLARRLAAMAG
jgi:predicted DNA-binding transcriptional regulator YafY